MFTSVGAVVSGAWLPPPLKLPTPRPVLSGTIVAFTPQPTPTPFTGGNGFPTVDLTEQYQGKRYTVELAQPVQTGPKGIWVITSIKAA